MTPATRHHDHEIIAALEELFEDPENRDDAEGGVHHSVIAQHLGMARSTAKDRLRELATEGRIEKYDGLDPDTKRWRPSYAPVEESPEGDGGRTTPS